MSNEQAGEPANSPSTQSRPSRRPSLNAEPADATSTGRTLPPGAAEPSTSILNALSSTMQMPAIAPVASSPARWKPWAAAAAIAALAAAGWAAYVGTRSGEPGVMPSRLDASTQKAAPAPVVPSVAAEPASAALAAASSPAVAVARIEDMPVTTNPSTTPAAQPAATPTAASVAPDTPLAPAATAVAVASVAPALAAASATSTATTAAPAVPVPPAARTTRREAPVEARTPSRTEARSDARAEAPRRKDVKLAMVDGRVAESPGQAAARSVSQSSTRQDSDVDLMAALLDHMAATEPARAADASPAVRKAAAPSAGVAATRPTTISGLVASCRQAGDKRAVTECRKRICKGYWGKADACPARLAPTASARKRSTGG